MSAKLARFRSNLGNGIMVVLKLNIYNCLYFPSCIINSFLQQFIKKSDFKKIKCLLNLAEKKARETLHSEAMDWITKGLEKPDLHWRNRTRSF